MSKGHEITLDLGSDAECIIEMRTRCAHLSREQYIENLILRDLPAPKNELVAELMAHTGETMTYDEIGMIIEKVYPGIILLERKQIFGGLIQSGYIQTSTDGRFTVNHYSW